MATTRHACELNDPERYYKEHAAKLIELAVKQFHIAVCDAQRLAHEVIVSSLLAAPGVNRQRWLVAAMRAAVGRFVRERRGGGGRDIPPQGDAELP